MNNNAPNASGYGHCTDEWDVMCYKDGADVVVAHRVHRTGPTTTGSTATTTTTTAPTRPPGRTCRSTTTSRTTCSSSRVPAAATRSPTRNLARSAAASASYTSAWESVAAINDGIDPPSSNDTVNPRWGTWPNSGEQWAELTWPAPLAQHGRRCTSSTTTRASTCRRSWKLQYWTGSAYADVPGASGYPVAANAYITVTFTRQHHPAAGLLQSNGTSSVGLLEVKAYAG